MIEGNLHSIGLNPSNEHSSFDSNFSYITTQNEHMYQSITESYGSEKQMYVDENMLREQMSELVLGCNNKSTTRNEVSI